MTQVEFEKVFNEMVDKSRAILLNKAAEYATDGDRLINFKQAAHLEGIKQSTALAGMMAKHTVSIYNMISQYEKGVTFTQEKWDEKIIDNFNYLILLQAILTEEKTNGDIICANLKSADSSIKQLYKGHASICGNCKFIMTDEENDSYDRCSNNESHHWKYRVDSETDSCSCFKEME